MDRPIGKGKSDVENKGASDPGKYIKGQNYTNGGEVALSTSYSLGEEFIRQEENENELGETVKRQW